MHADGHLGGIEAGDPAADDDDIGRSHTGYAAKQGAPAPLRLFKAVGADLDGHPAGNLAHRLQ